MSENENPKFKVVHGEETKPEEPKRPRTGTVFDDLDRLRKNSKLTVRRKNLLTNVVVGKPSSECHFRCSPVHFLDRQAIVKDPKSGAIYYVDEEMWGHPRFYEKRLRLVTLTLAVTWPHNGALIWPVPILDAREFKPWKAERAAYESSLERWTSMVWSDPASSYIVECAEGLDHEPSWPAESFGELLAMGFRDRIITDAGHPYLKQLSGIDG